MEAEKILIIEGNTSFGKQLSDSLTKEGYAVTFVSDGTKAVDTIVNLLPHLIILDVVVPGMDGYEILQKKHAEPLLSKIPVFLISTQSTPINMRRVPENSVAEFVLSFHSNPSDIVEKINNRFNHPSRKIAEVKTTGKKVLWVEDDKLIGTILEKKMLSSGLEVLHATNGDEALRTLESVVPSCIILDLLLPGMGGFDILRKIRTHPEWNDIPVMILSNLNKPGDIEKAKMLGAKKYLVKAATSLDQIVEEVADLCA